MSDNHHFRLASSFLAADRLAEKSFTGLRALHHGMWLGLLNRESLNHLTAAGYDLWQGYHSSNYNKSGLWKWEMEALEEFFYGRCESILVAASGAGREMLAVAKQGIRVDGFDCSTALLQQAKELLAQQGNSSKLYYAPPDCAPALEKIYDGLLIGWTSYSHIQGSANRVSFLRALRQYVAIGGPTLLSFFARDGAHERAYRLTASTARLFGFWRPSAERAELGDTLAQGVYLHFFRRDELARELAAAGFKLVQYNAKGFGHAVAIAV